MHKTVSRVRKMFAALAVMSLVAVATVVWSTSAQADVVPVAYEDAYAAGHDEVIDIAAPGVLSNDFGVNSNYRAKLVSSEIDSAQLDFNGDGSFTFDPDGAGDGEYDFTYCIVARGSSDCVSDPTVVRLYSAEAYVPNHSYVTSQNTQLTVGSPGLLIGAQNVNPGDYLYVIGYPGNGTLNANHDGSFDYTPAVGFIGTDNFIYCISNDPLVANDQCEGAPSYGAISVYPSAQAQSISTDVDVAYDGRLYSAPSGHITFTGLVTTAPTHGTVGVNNDGTFTYRPSTGYVGPDSFRFCISQDDENCLSGGNTATVTISVDRVTTTTSVSAPASAFYSQPVTITATVNPSDGSGTVAFTNGGTPIPGCAAQPLNATGKATCVLSPTVGSHTFTAAYSGTTVYAGSISGPEITSVTKAPTQVLYLGPSTAVGGAPFAASAILLNPLGTPGIVDGAVLTFSVAGGTSCTATTSGGGIASCDLTPAGPGTPQVSVSYAGSANYLSSSDQATVTVSKIPTVTVLTAAPVSSTFTAPVRLTATVTPNDGSGTVHFTHDGAAIAGCPDAAPNLIDGKWTATCVTSALTVGSDDLVAAFSGTTTYLGSTDTATVGVAAATTALVYTGDTTATVGHPVTLSAYLDNTAGLGVALPEKSVTFTWGGASCSADTNASGVASCTATATAVSQTGKVTAAFAGDESYLKSSVDSQISVAPEPTSLTLTGPSTAVSTTAVTLTASVAPTDGGGTVSFGVGEAALAGCQDVTPIAVDGKWTAGCTTSALTIGDNLVTASYSGTDDYLASDGSTTVTITAAPTAITYTGSTAGTVGASLETSAVLTNVAGDPVPLSGQTLVFTLGDSTCDAVTNGVGRAECPLDLTEVDQTGSLTVTFAATASWLASDASVPVVVAPASTSLALVGPTGSVYSSPVTFVATVSPTDGAGTVTFSVGGTALADCRQVPTSPVGDAWQASCTTSALAVGDETVTATYSGTANYLTSKDSSNITVAIAPTSLTYTGARSGTVGRPLTVSARLIVDPSSTTPTTSVTPTTSSSVTDTSTSSTTESSPTEATTTSESVTTTSPLPPAVRRAGIFAAAATPVLPVSGQRVTFTLGDRTCHATTDATGTASCVITPDVAGDPAQLTAAFAGTGSFVGSDSTVGVVVAEVSSTVTSSASTSVPNGTTAEGTTTADTGTTAPGTTAAGTTSSAEPAGAALPNTGTPAARLTVIGGLLLVGGALTLVVARTRRRTRLH